METELGRGEGWMRALGEAWEAKSKSWSSIYLRLAHSVPVGAQRPDISPLVSREAKAMRVQDTAKQVLWRRRGRRERG